MEPIFELATQITSHLWLLHELDPNEADVAKVLNSKWRETLEEQAAADFSRLQALLDLTGQTKEGDWDPTNPLSRFRVGGQEEEKFYWKSPRRLWQTKSKNLELRQEQSAELRNNAAQPALDVLGARVRVLLAQGLPSENHFLPRGFPDNLTQLVYVPSPSLLTREELFENTANWLLSCPVETARVIAIGFVGCEDTNEISTHGETNEPAESTATDGPASQGQKAKKRVKEFLMYEEISSQAKRISEMHLITMEADDPRRSAAQSWLQKTPEEQLTALLSPSQLHDICYDLQVPIPFSMVLSDELNEIKNSRFRRLHETKPNAQHLGATRLDAEKPDLIERDATNPDAAKTQTNGSDTPKPLAPPGVDCSGGLAQQRAFRSCLFGLALSGGGIRSATFALGLLQGMADRNVLPYIDLISTVSGGGYIGSWLVSWIKRRGSVESVQTSMRGSASTLRLGPNCPTGSPLRADDAQMEPLRTVTHNTDPHSDHVRPIRLLREYSRYLAPQAGAFSADTWTIATTWLRNTILNLIVLLLFFGAALLLPRVLIFVLLHLGAFATGRASKFQMFSAIVIASIPIFRGCWLIRTRNLQTFGPYQWQRNQESRGDSDSRVISTIVPWLLLGAFLEVAMLWHFLGNNEHLPHTAAWGFATVIVAGISMLGLGLKTWPRKTTPGVQVGPQVTKLARLIAMAGSAVCGWGLISWLGNALNKFGENTERGVWIVGSVGIALMLFIVVFVVGVFIGLAGTALSDEQREWWSRLGAWFGLAVVVWLVLCAICFFAPLWIAMLGLKAAAAGIGWAAITSAGVKIAFSAKSGRDGAGESTQNWFYTVMLKIAPFVFVLGLLAGVSLILFWSLQSVVNSLWFDGGVSDQRLCCVHLPMTFQSMEENYWPLMHPGSLAPVCLMIALFLLCLLVAWRVDINEFSMHHFYKNRLVRAYLGSSRARAHRFPNAFTGFDLEDDIRLWRFRKDDKTQPRDMAMDCKSSYVGPYPIINTAVNITRGADLGIQDRKAESFIFTPLWSGFDFSRRQIAVKKTTLSEYAFQRTDQFGEPENDGVQLGTAMAISGAAFSSNAGFHTSPSLAFLLTVFGVRLGWWAGNPRGTEWQKSSPRFGLLYLIRELTADTSTSSPFVLLSDGGHFENMALYELVRRRCRFIVLSDAEEDEKFKLEGIGGAIRKCRDDFGVVIDLNVKALEPLGDPAVSRLHYSLGTIIYPGETQCGKLLYIKSSVTGDEPVDVIEFRKRHPEFPHTSTVDQFFDESHFESYRALGHHIASEIFSIDMPKLPLQGSDTACHHLATLFERIASDWQKRLNQSEEKEAAESRESVTESDNPKNGDTKGGSQS